MLSRVSDPGNKPQTSIGIIEYFELINNTLKCTLYIIIISNTFLFLEKDADWEAVLLIPLLATIILALTVFLIVLFRQSPIMVIGTISGCVIFIGIYLILTALNTATVVLE